MIQSLGVQLLPLAILIIAILLVKITGYKKYIVVIRLLFLIAFVTVISSLFGIILEVLELGEEMSMKNVQGFLIDLCLDGMVIILGLIFHLNRFLDDKLKQED